MSRRSGSSRSQFPATPEGVAKAREWFASSGSSTEGVADWDIKTQALAEVVLGLLAQKCAVMFGVALDGRAVSVTIYEGDAKQRKWVTDAIEFDDLIALVGNQLRGRDEGKVTPIAKKA